MIGYVKTFKGKESNNKLLSLCTDDEKLLERYKATSPMIEDLKNIKINALQFYDDRYIKTKITIGNKVYNDFRGVYVTEDDTDCEYFTVISINVELMLYYDILDAFDAYYTFLYLDLLLINIKLKVYVTYLFLYIFLL